MKHCIIANKLEELPASINALQRLIALDISSNRISFLPATIGDLIYLQELAMADNSISTVPPEFVRLQVCNIR